MSLNRIVPETRKAKMSKKVLPFSPSRLPRKTLFSSSVSSTMLSSTGNYSDQKITFNGTQKSLKNIFLQTKAQTGTGDVCGAYNAPVADDVILPVWHKMTEATFERFLYQIDWILEKLQIKECTSDSDSTPRYEDICQKLRAEILLALDKLNLLAMPNTIYTKEEVELLHNLNNLKGQLSDLRGQYHSLIKNFGTKMNQTPSR